MAEEAAPKVERICNGLAAHYGLGHLKGAALKDSVHIHAELAPITYDTTDWAQTLCLMAPHMPADSWLILERRSSSARRILIFCVDFNHASYFGRRRAAIVELGYKPLFHDGLGKLRPNHTRAHGQDLRIVALAGALR